MWNQLLEKLGSLDPGVLKNAALMIAGGFTGLVRSIRCFFTGFLLLSWLII